MPLSTQPDPKLNLNTLPKFQSLQSLDENYQEGANNLARSPFGPPAPNTGLARLGAGSPASLENGGRIFSKRTREIQAAEGLMSGNTWTTTGSSGSTPSREFTKEAVGLEGFPDLVPPVEPLFSERHQSRARAGTLPSRLISLTGNGVTTPLTLSSRPTPSASPFSKSTRQDQDASQESRFLTPPSSTILSRYRAGSTPQRLGFYTGQSSTSGHSSVWTPNHDRNSLWQTPHVSDTSSDQIQVSTPENLQSQTEIPGYLSGPEKVQSVSSLPPHLANLSLQLNPNRFRSYSVNAKETYIDDEANYISTVESAAIDDSFNSSSLRSNGLAISQSNSQMPNRGNVLIDQLSISARPRAQTIGVAGFTSRSDSKPSAAGNPSDINSHSGPEHGEYLHTSSANPSPRYVQSLPVGPSVKSFSGPSDVADRLESSRSLWLGNVPTDTTSSSLEQIFAGFGPIESIRLLPAKNCCFVNFYAVESAVRAKAALNGIEMFSGHGITRLGFAKSPNSAAPGNSLGRDTYSYSQPSNLPPEILRHRIKSPSVFISDSLDPQMHGRPRTEFQSADIDPDQLEEMIRFLGAPATEVSAGLQLLIRGQKGIALAFAEIGPAPESSHTRLFDAPQLREIRKRLDNGTMLSIEIEDTAAKMSPEVAELASDYLGNTVVQKLFEFCSESTKEVMLARIGPHLAEIGVHKNGTWAAQKIIERAATESQVSLVVESLRPYTVPLFLDQYGNYVLQCCLRFGPPATDFLFECILARLWSLAQGRFGARAIRACLESHFATETQLRSVSAAIALLSPQLAYNSNSALLLTWYLDSCGFPKRRSILARQLAQKIVELCTHKLGHLIIIKILSQRAEPEACTILLRAIFFDNDPHTLYRILSDQGCGLMLISKVITAPFLEKSIRDEIAGKIRDALQALNLLSLPSYKRLGEEVGFELGHTSMDVPAVVLPDTETPSSLDQLSHVHPSLERSRASVSPNGRLTGPYATSSGPFHNYLSNVDVEFANYPNYPRDLRTSAQLPRQNRHSEEDWNEFRSTLAPQAHVSGNYQRRPNRHYQHH